MMPNRILKGFAAAAAFVILTAGAAAAGSYSISVAGGAGVPSGDFGQAYGTSWNLNGAVDYEISRLWGMGVDLGYNTWNGKSAYEDGLAAFSELFLGSPAGTTADAKTTAFQYGVHATVTPPVVGPVHPFVQAGAGAYSLKETIELSDPNSPLNGDVSKTMLGFNFGAGVDFTAAPTVSVGIDGKYHYISSKDDYGYNTSWFAVQGKVTFHVPLAK